MPLWARKLLTLPVSADAEPCVAWQNHSFRKGFSPGKGRVVFFEKPTQKISTLFPLPGEIRQVCACRQADHTQNENTRWSACPADCTCRIAGAADQIKKVLLLSLVTQCESSPSAHPASHLPKTRGN